VKRSTRNILGPLAATVAALSIAACSGASSKAGGGPATGATPALPPTSAQIDQDNLEFVPAQVTVKVGDVVLIKNSETAIHNAVVGGKNVTGNMMKGSAIPWTAPASTASIARFHPGRLASPPEASTALAWSGCGRAINPTMRCQTTSTP